MTPAPLVALAAAVAVLVVANVLNNRLARSAYLPTSLVTTALLLAVFGLTNVPWADAGLGRDALARGARWALVLVTLVAVGYLVGALLPATRRVFLDRRVAHAGPGTVAYQVLVRIPVGTVLLEEVAFRGVLYGLLRHPYGIAWATAVSAALFGLWHVLPARELPRLNPVAGRVFGTHPALVIPAAVIATALAGVVLCELQRRSGGLLAPIALHWAINALGYLTALLVTRWHRGRYND
jgi:membrane protease YdiL (CAAX protease family)